MTEWIVEHLLFILSVHFGGGFIGLMTTLFTTRRVIVCEILYALIFGVFYMLHEFGDMNAVVIKLPSKDKR